MSRDEEPAHVLAEALTAALAPFVAAPAHETPLRVAVAFSGGADSTALLHSLAAFAVEHPVVVFAFHVHHGLVSAADAWEAHCRDEAARLDIAFAAERVAPSRMRGSVEAAARQLRYAALTSLCRRHDCRLLLTAHHADDQAETVLVNLARGAGIGGLAATARQRTQDGVAIVRPFLDVPSGILRRHVDALGLQPVEDPSNHDRRFTRNAIRHEVMPPLRRIAPTIAARLARTATHAASMQALLDEIGAEDLDRGDSDAAAPSDLDRDVLAALSEARAANALRVWLARRGMRAPSAPALREMLQQLLHASADAQIALLHERSTLRLYRGRVSVEPGAPPRAGYRPIAWHGEERVAVPEWHGTLVFASDPGDATVAFAANLLREGPLALRERRGGERLKAHVDGPSRTLKNLYQEAGIPAWHRARLPLLYLADRLIFAAGLGPHAGAAAVVPLDSPGISIRWIVD